MRKIIMSTAMAIALTLGVGMAAYAWHGQGGHANSRNHGASFLQHGGGHEQAQNNSTIHNEAEKNDPRHRD